MKSLYFESQRDLIMKTNLNIKMIEVNDTLYASDEGYVLQREYGVTPAGTQLHGEWVLRDPTGAFMHYDQHRHDIFSRFRINSDSAKTLYL
jgi:hypothetical protein